MTFIAKVKKNVKIVMTNLVDTVLKTTKHHFVEGDTEKALACHISMNTLLIIPQVFITLNHIFKIIWLFSSIAIHCILQLPLYGVV